MPLVFANPKEGFHASRPISYGHYGRNMSDASKTTLFVSPSLVLPGCVGQSVTCLTADPGVGCLIPARSHTCADIDHEIFSTAILLPSADSRRVVVSYK